MRECPNCFTEMDEDCFICPRCGHCYGQPLSGKSPLDTFLKRRKIVHRMLQFFVVAAIVTGALLGKFYGDWGWMVGGFFIGVGCAFVVFFAQAVGMVFSNHRFLERYPEFHEQDLLPHHSKKETKVALPAKASETIPSADNTKQQDEDQPK